MKTTIRPELLDRLNAAGRVLVDEPMSRHTTFRTGGPADALVYARDVRALQEIVRLVKGSDQPLTVIGGGSNLLVSDRGIRGITVRMSADGVFQGNISIRNDGAVYADSTILKEDFIAFCLDHELSGMEFMAGIPGCLGGGIIMNAGTTMGNFIDIVESIDYVNSSGELKTLRLRREMAGYRRLDVEEGAIITGGCFRLARCPDIRRTREIVNGILRDRSMKHPLAFPSAGSVFKNPDGHSSWKLVDDAGLKGCRIGGAMVSELHTNFIINFDNASSSDILRLIEHVRETVHARFNITLVPEIRLIGEL
jgi:UDP-N-acetylmuramate dehydrogenase